MTTRRASALALATALVMAGVSACSSGSDSSSSSNADHRSDCVPEPPPAIDDGFPTPEVRASEDGVLETTLRASYSEVELNGEPYTTLNYEGSVPGPTLVVCPGDTLIVHLENDLGDAPAEWVGGAPQHEHDVPLDQGQVTNLHTHGFHVSPEGNSDNVFVQVDPGTTFTYEFEIPDDHPPGMYWYHPHRHGFTELQVYAGMLGAIYVQGGLDSQPGFADIPTRTMVVNSLELGDGEVVPTQDSDTAKSPYFLNGVLEPDVAIRPGEVQRWQILNGNANAIVRLGLEGHEFHILANDGNTLEAASTDDVLLIGPGERREVLVQGGPAGEYRLESMEFAQFQGGDLAASTVATLRSEGEPVDDVLPQLDALTEHEEDLRDAEVATHHRIVFSERQVDDDFEFLLNGEVFDADRVDEVMLLDQVAEWVFVNDTTEWHTFHIHVNDFQVVDVALTEVSDVSNGQVRDVRLGEIDPEDTVKMPPGSTVTMRTRPTDFTGKFVYHCHMLFHEDRGMMGVVEVREEL